MKLIVGLGNPGKQYAQTRHNFGFMVVDSLCAAAKSKWTKNQKLAGEICKVGQTLYLKPTTFMNLSGEAVRATMHYYKIALADVLVIFDDKDLPLGTIRYRTAGSSGGHNGIKSIIAQLSSQDFARLKLGIAPTTPEQAIHDTADYVLAKFSKTEQKLLPDIITSAKAKLDLFCQPSVSL